MGVFLVKQHSNILTVIPLDAEFFEKKSIWWLASEN